MTAEIVFLADVRAARARVRCALTFDPVELWRGWIGFWMGLLAPRRQAAVTGPGVVRKIGGVR